MKGFLGLTLVAVVCATTVGTFSPADASAAGRARVATSTSTGISRDTASSRPGPLAFRVSGRVLAGHLASFAGSISGVPSATVAVQRLTGARWVQLARGTLGRRGRFALTWIAPARPGRVRVRAVLSHAGRVLATSPARQIVVLAAKGKRVVVFASTQILDSSTVSSAPSPGSRGTLRYSGGNDVKAGQILAIGRGPATRTDSSVRSPRSGRAAGRRSSRRNPRRCCKRSPPPRSTSSSARRRSRRARAGRSRTPPPPR